MIWTLIRGGTMPVNEPLLFRAEIPELKLTTYHVKTIEWKKHKIDLTTPNSFKFIGGKKRKCIATHWMQIPLVEKEK